MLVLRSGPSHRSLDARADSPPPAPRDRDSWAPSNSSRLRLAALALLAGLALGGCDSPQPEVDAGQADAAIACTSAAECDDGLYCNGPETCDPTSAGAGADGCVSGSPPCAGEACDEASASCTCSTDADNDGTISIECGGNDCDDNDAARFVGNTEVCDAEGVDEDCNPNTIGTLDGDGDGAISDVCCNTQADGTPMCGTDCDDTRANVSALASEACDGVDNDCDSLTDEGVLRTFYPDTDGDSFGDVEGATVDACAPPSDFVEDATDCDDDNRNINPVAAERCDTGVDEDCDSSVDEAGAVRYYADDDSDTYGDLSDFVESEECEPPTGYVAVAGDCNDASGAYYPSAPDPCDGRDTSCNLPISPGGADLAEDGDADQHAATDAACEVGDVGFGSYPRDDCDDAAMSVYPGAPELCDRRDNTCAIGGGVLASEDMDNDGHAPTTAACSGGPLPRDDCNDDASTVYLGAPELCDGLDNRCLAGGGALPSEDMDGDMHSPIGSSCDGGPFPEDDCDDDAATTYPGAPQLCNRIDDLCASGGGVRVAEDVDDDGFAPIGADCSGGPLPATDCEDSVASTFPGATETCGGGNQDCDGLNDQNDPDAAEWCGAQARCTATGCFADGPIGVTGSFDSTASFAIRAGAGYAWGDPSFDGLSGDRRVRPAAVVELSSTESVAPGVASTCAIATDRTLRCWGGGEAFDETILLTTPTVFAAPADVIEASVGFDVTCLRTPDDVLCWGNNDSGAAGSDSGSVAAPTSVPFATALEDQGGPRQIVAGARHQCVLTRSGAVQCWGEDGDGRLGRGTMPEVPSDQVFAPAAPVSNLDDAIAIAAGGRLTCAVRADHTVTCWGRFTAGTPPSNGFFFDSNVPEAIAGLTDVAQLAIGTEHVCARLTSGAVRCWGGNADNQLGDGSGGFSEVPVTVPGIGDAVFLAAGGHNTCALRATGEVRCWGPNDDGELGDGTTTERVPFPVPVDGLTDATMVRATSTGFCAQRSGGNGLVCWGLAPLGDGNPSSGLGPVAVLDSAMAIDLGGSSLARCFVRSDGTAACWGPGDLGGPVSSSDTPVDVTGVSDALVVARGPANHVCVAGPGGLQCWGTNEQGQLGTEDTTPSSTPVTSGFSFGSIAALGVGLQHTCVLHGGGVSCFGNGGLGSLGDGNGANSLTPVSVSGISSATDLATGVLHSCARLADGTVRCWGWNQVGMLGDGTTTDRLSPVTVPGLTDAVQVAVRQAASCAARASGAVSCWGSNSSGQLGDGTFSGRLSPVDVLSLTDATHVALNDNAGCARRSGGGVSCWGRRDFLGNATQAAAPSTPVTVLLP